MEKQIHTPEEMFEYIFQLTVADRNRRKNEDFNKLIYPDRASKLKIINAVKNMMDIDREPEYLIAAIIGYLEGYAMGMEASKLK